MRVEIPSELIQKLTGGSRRPGCKRPLNAEAMLKIAELYGIVPHASCRFRSARDHDAFWNRTIDQLDTDYPGWRGYPNPTVHIDTDRVA